jgi:hypothetical protein
MLAADETPSTSRRFRWVYGALAAFLAAALAARVAWLDRLPGLNGDETWYALQLGAERMQWRTPTGNPVNPFYLLPLGLAQALLGPSFWVLRVPSVLAGVLLVGLGWPLLRRPLGNAAAAAFCVLAAGLPILIAYSRFGWDASETGLASLLVLALALRRRWVWTAIAVAAALAIHPTNLFLAVVVLALFAQDQVRAPEHRARRLALLLGSLAVLAAAAAVLVDVVKQDVLSAISWSRARDHALDVHGWIQFAGLYGDLLSGVTAYRFIVGPVSSATALLHAAIFWSVAALVIPLGCRRLQRQGEGRATALVLGLSASLAALYLLFGALPLTPHYERYGQFLVVPSLLVLAWCLPEVLPRRSSTWALLAALVLGVLSLSSVAANYFRPLLATGGDSHRAFRTAPKEPKLQIARALLDDGAGERGAVVLAEDWWLAGPLRYALAAHPNILVPEPHPALPPQAALEQILQHGGYVVAWGEGSLRALVEQGVPPTQRAGFVVVDGAGRPLILLWRLRPARPAR